MKTIKNVPRDLAPLFLDRTSLDWAFNHVQRFGDSDIFPIPFEFAAYAAVWPAVRDYLAGVDLAHCEITGSLKMMVPKHSEGFRGATQLNPFDALLYTALVFESAEAIERFRKPKEVACAYRLEITKEGTLFQKDSGWSQFHNTSKTLLESKDCEFVLCADISDYYNQISHHRLQGALEQAGVDENRSKVIERFLGNVNALHHSRGIPVGPFVSILLAEVCLADVGNFLSRKYSHTRYVDDFRVFCRSSEEGLQALHDLSEYLYTAHRLSLQAGKTKICTKDQFRKDELSDPVAQEREAKEQRLEKITQELRKMGYPEPEEVAADFVNEGEVAIAVLNELLETVLTRKYFPLALGRFVLRRAASLRCRAILPRVLENVEKFIPVIRDLMLYLIKMARPRTHHPIGAALEHLITRSDWRSFPFVQYWALTAIQQVPEFANSEKGMAWSSQSDPSIRDRMLALTARAYGLADWVRGKKETWSNTSIWAQRANIRASSVLPREERGHWLQPIRNNPDRSISAVADAVFMSG
jgi:hypothetical protein